MNRDQVAAGQASSNRRGTVVRLSVMTSEDQTAGLPDRTGLPGGDRMPHTFMLGKRGKMPELKLFAILPASVASCLKYVRGTKAGRKNRPAGKG